MKKYLYLLFVAVLGGAIALGGAKLLQEEDLGRFDDNPVTTAKFTNYTSPSYTTAVPSEGFTTAAERVLPVVVHIRASKQVENSGRQLDLRNIPAPFRDFFERQGPQGQAPGGDQMQQGTGSGVIISSDGYIVTNNHVAGDASELQVTLHDGRVYDAEVVGADPSTDIAVIKIDDAALPHINFANSDDVRVGEWVVAVGNPFNLASTVTAGIVSAKGRSINILQDQAPIESFIQTDAVVNPGNSGGALVNLNGDLIGINTAIASPTGVYAGYAFAVPSNIAAKVIKDLKEFGVVQRGYLGAIIRGIDGNFAKENDLSVNEGVYIQELNEDGAAAAAGIKPGDVVLYVDEMQTKTSSALLEAIGRKRPGEEVTLTVLRNGNEREIDVVLRNREGTTDVVKKGTPAQALAAMGATFETITKEEARAEGIDGGVRVKAVGPGKLAQQTEIREGFIITRVDKQKVTTKEDLIEKLENVEGGLLLEGKYPGQRRNEYYAIGMQ
ncbi:Do family serine endopeptidase [Flavilitoribacter nigricans]|uniref:Serine protease n=1 Tax=Flavilitoribacter nigricans (strain ATCC 23147 / DSM 23189 / NBRC 102662 / NCIMB 1420 / SS-2) TaxID=1122177 RepID=A0A2D0MYI3_FLAN2|nr:Do family serine endopeptidase [Flavilitoribacter nigricans]PHN01198.1 serine protease [Flavilitoribacter nigricans DSM 23189 = NBRC 102662]